MPYLHQYDYIFGLGTVFALLEAFNNGANDVANSWATSVSSRSITYRWAMVLAFIFELLGALTVGARTASTIKDGIISSSAFQGNAGVALLAFASAAVGAGSWVMYCSRNNITVSSTYSLVSSLIGVGIATGGGANGVQWSWNSGKGVAAIFAGLFMAPAISGAFGGLIFTLIKYLVHVRRNPVPWAVWSSPLFFLIAGTICTLTIVYKGSPSLNLANRPADWIAGVTVGTGFALCLVSALFFLPFVHAKVIKKDYTLRTWEIIKGPLLWRRAAPSDAQNARVPDFSVIQHGAGLERGSTEVDEHGNPVEGSPEVDEKGHPVKKTIPADEEHSAPHNEVDLITHERYQQMLKEAEERHHANLRKSRGPLGWAMRFLHNHPRGAGSIHEWQNLWTFLIRIPAMIVVALTYGASYDIHAAQIGIEGTPEGKRMARTYAMAPKYSNEVEYLYSFVQIITACTASFAHGANDIGNAVGVWAGMYAAWSKGKVPGTEDVPLWQIAVLVLTLCFGFVTYGYNIMKVMGNKITYHSPSRGASMELGAAITVMVFSQYKLPVSTTMCITGATVGVGLCNWNIRAVNWKRVFLIVFSWIMTIPIAGLIGGCVMGLFLNAPGFGKP